MTPVDPEILIALNAGIQSEIASYVFYVEAAKRIGDTELKGILQELAHEEKEHFQILERQHHSLVTSEKWISTADILKEPGLPEIGEEMAGKHQALVEEVQNATDTVKVLKIAYRLEVEAFELFSKQVEIARTDEGKTMFATLAKFEKGHMNMVQGMIDKYS